MRIITTQELKNGYNGRVRVEQFNPNSTFQFLGFDNRGNKIVVDIKTKKKYITGLDLYAAK